MKARKVFLLMAVLTAMTVCGCGQKNEAPENGTEIAAITETEEPTETVLEETEEPEDTEELQVEAEVTEEEEARTSQDSVKEMSATKYAKSTVNVRKGPSADTEKLGGLSMNQKVTVTGQADNGWYRIDFNGESGFVSDKYLVDEKVTTASAGNSNGSTAGNNATGGTTGGSAGAGTNAGTGVQGNAGTDNGTAGNASNNSGSTNAGDTGNGSGSADAGNTGSTGTGAGSDAGNAGNTDTASGTPDNAGGSQSEYENSSSGTTISGEDAEWFKENGGLDMPGIIINPDGSITLP